MSFIEFHWTSNWEEEETLSRGTAYGFRLNVVVKMVAIGADVPDDELAKFSGWPNIWLSIVQETQLSSSSSCYFPYVMKALINAMGSSSNICIFNCVSSGIYFLCPTRPPPTGPPGKVPNSGKWKLDSHLRNWVNLSVTQTVLPSWVGLLLFVRPLGSRWRRKFDYHYFRNSVTKWIELFPGDLLIN